MHRIAAHLMVVAVVLHLVRVFLTGAYKNGTGRGQQREWNWVIGVVMLLLTLFLSFTGYLLPWDQLAYWAVTVGTNIASSIPYVGADGARAADRRARDRAGDAHPLLRAALHRAAGRARRAVRVPHVARAEGRRAREGDRAAMLPRRAREAPVATEDLHPARRRARHRAARSAAASLEAPDLTRQRGAGSDAARAIVMLATFALVSILASAASRRRSRSPPTRSSRPTPRRRRGTSSGCRRSSPTRRSARLVHDQRRVPRAASFCRACSSAAHRVAVARQEPDRRGRGLVRRRPRRRRTSCSSLVLLVILVLTIVGTFMRGPYWNFYWPWEAWPEIPARI